MTVFNGIVNLGFTCVAIFTVEKLARKPLLITGSLGMAFGCHRCSHHLRVILICSCCAWYPSWFIQHHLCSLGTNLLGNVARYSLIPFVVLP